MAIKLKGSTCALISFVLVVAYFGYVFAMRMKEYSIHSTVASITAGFKRVKNLPITTESEWVSLSESQIDQIIREINPYIDNGMSGWHDGAYLDPWGNRFCIEMRCEDKATEYRVSSSGPDEKILTSDDTFDHFRPGLKVGR